MRGTFYILRRPNGLPVKKCEPIEGYISLHNRELHCYDKNNNLTIHMDVSDVTISSDNIYIEGIEDIGNKITYQEISFIPSTYYKEK